MIKKIFLFCFFTFLISCGSSKKVTSTHTSRNSKTTIIDKIIWTAVSYKGTPYKFGGTTQQGMDCSGLIYTSFKKRGVILPRVSYRMAEQGYKISLQKVQRGDLLFFKTSKTKNKINHVGLVTSVVNNEIKFIHSTTSKGVVVSSLFQKYWSQHFKKAKRIL